VRTDHVSLKEAASRVRGRRDEHRLEELDRENARLRTELHAATEELGHERERAQEMMDLLRRRTDGVKVKVKRRGGIVRTAIVGGTAYLLGTRAGRQRCDQSMGWVRRVGDRMERAGEKPSTVSVSEAVGPAARLHTESPGHGMSAS